MIKTGIGPIYRREMTGITLSRGLNMLCMFASGQGSIMTVRAGTTRLYIVMIKIGGCPIDRRRMAAVALRISWDMCCRFSRCNGSVMAA